MWEAVGSVTSAFALVAFFAAAGVTAYVFALKRETDLLKAVPENDRASASAKVLQRFPVDPSVLTKESQFNLAKIQLSHQLTKFMIIAGVVFGIFCLATAISIVALTRSPQPAGDSPKMNPQPVVPDKKQDAKSLVLTGPEVIPQKIARISVKTTEGKQEERTEEHSTFRFKVHNPNPKSVSITGAAYYNDFKIRFEHPMKQSTEKFETINHQGHIQARVDQPVNFNPHIIDMKIIIPPESVETFTIWFWMSELEGQEGFVTIPGTLKISSDVGPAQSNPFVVTIGPDSRRLNYKP